MPKTQNPTNPNFWLYLGRAIRLRCPVCGISPIFLPLSRVENITEWVDTLEGCPRCDYRYHREPGYFLFALWVVNFGIVAIFGLIEMIVLDTLFRLSAAALIVIILLTMWILFIITVRHTKSTFLALDHLWMKIESDV